VPYIQARYPCCWVHVLWGVWDDTHLLYGRIVIQLYYWKNRGQSMQNNSELVCVCVRVRACMRAGGKNHVYELVKG